MRPAPRNPETCVSFFEEGMVAGVLTTEPLGRTLDYLAPEGGCALGAFVEVPLGPRRVLGVVWGEAGGTFPAREAAGDGAGAGCRAHARGDARVSLRAADYTLTPMPAMLRLATRSPGLGDPPSMRVVYRAGGEVPDRMTGAREKVLAVLEEFGEAAFTLGELAGWPGCRPGS
jgi:primosomal protein N' (replication factor Y) (superfamily II helicase)